MRGIVKLDRVRNGVDGLQRLLDRSPPTSPDRPMVLVRLGRGYIDLSHEASMEAAQPVREHQRCALLQESADALQRAQASFKRVLDEYPGTMSSDTALFWTASLSMQTDPLRSAAAFEKLVRKHKTRSEIDASRIALAETLLAASHAATDRERARAELAKVDPKHPDELFFIAQHRLAELAWVAGDGEAARRHLERLRAAVSSTTRRQTIEQNLAYMVGQ